jgi:hypothetical protein
MLIDEKMPRLNLINHAALERPTQPTVSAMTPWTALRSA